MDHYINGTLLYTRGECRLTIQCENMHAYCIV